MISTDAKLNIRWMIRRDMPEVLEIERLCFEYPWSEDNFIRCLRQRNCIGMVVDLIRPREKVFRDDNDHVIGFMIYELHKARLHILNLAVEPAFQREGVGTAMVDKLKKKLFPQRRTRIDLEMRETNLDGQLFFRRQGFRAVSVMRDFYDDVTEDAYLFSYRQKMGEY